MRSLTPGRHNQSPKVGFSEYTWDEVLSLQLSGHSGKLAASSSGTTSSSSTKSSSNRTGASSKAALRSKTGNPKRLRYSQDFKKYVVYLLKSGKETKKSIEAKHGLLARTVDDWLARYAGTIKDYVPPSSQPPKH